QIPIRVLPIVLEQRTLAARGLRVAVVLGDEHQRVVRPRIMRIVVAHLIRGPCRELPVADLARGPGDRLEREQPLGPRIRPRRRSPPASGATSSPPQRRAPPARGRGPRETAATRAC